MKYRFTTTATMKEHNCKKWWIDPGYIRPITVEAETLAEALDAYRHTVEDRYYTTISDNAMRRKSAMYIDTKSGEARQVGYVITGQTEFETDFKWVKQYIDLWVSVETIIDTDFKEAI